MSDDQKRLIEVAFPLKQASLDSVHEKNVRHGHISTLHIWPARRPLAACRAALIATLLPDPGSPEKRKELLEKIGGRVVENVERKKMPNGRVVEKVKEETVGGILHWKRETENADVIQWFQQEIRKAYGGRAPKVLDPFAGGGAIPLEAMRLGCEATAIDINPVAWFILKCTLEYPQKLAGQKRPLPEFVLEDEEFMEAFYKAHPGMIGQGKPSKRQMEMLFDALHDSRLPAPEADLAWHVRAWGKWVLDRARKDLARFYPTYADFEPLAKAKRKPKPYEPRPMKLVPLKDDGIPDIDALNAEFGSLWCDEQGNILSKEAPREKRKQKYLDVPGNPRWIAKPTVAYLWARTVQCKNCRATIPLLKTRWLCKKANKRVLLTMEPNADKTGVVFGIQNDVPVVGGNAAQRREHDKKVGAGTMSRSGATCPCCRPTIMSMEDIRLEGQAKRLGAVMTAVVVHGQRGQEFRCPTVMEERVAAEAADQLGGVYGKVPFGALNEATPAGGGSGAGRAFSVQGYGLMQWADLYSPRQLLGLGRILLASRSARHQVESEGYSSDMVEAILAYMAIALDRLADRCSTICTWDQSYTKVNHTFHRYALPITWDYCEGNPLSSTTGNYLSSVEWAAKYVAHALVGVANSPSPHVILQSATQGVNDRFDIVLTDPPYYDAIPYSDLMDFFYVWLRRCMAISDGQALPEFQAARSPKWDPETGDGELVDDETRHENDKVRSRQAYENGMLRAFQSANNVLADGGRMVIVFANKQPEAWETLVSAVIRAGSVVTGSWPIATEMSTGLRNYGRASLASSVWLVCKKRPATAKAGWDNVVLDGMSRNIKEKLRDYWDAEIRGPDFVWAATGPALESYSKHPVVKKADEPGEVMTVSEFLRHVRRIVVNFVVGRVLSHNGDPEAVSGLDDVTTYYLLHRHDFGLNEAPVGACILYAISCGLSDTALANQYDMLSSGSRSGSTSEESVETEDEEAETESGSGSTVKLKPWRKRNRKTMGYEAPGGQPVPLIDQVHLLMHLWKAGDVMKVDEYLDDRGLRRHALFHQLLQSLIELASPGSEERSLLESISNHVQARGKAPEKPSQIIMEMEPAPYGDE